MLFLWNIKKIIRAYIDLIINEMLPKIASENLADYIDAFLKQDIFQ